MKPQVGRVIAVSIKTIRCAEMWMASCVACDPTADFRFDAILTTLMRVPTDTEVLMSEPARCPSCGSEIFEHTLVELQRNSGAGGASDTG